MVIILIGLILFFAVMAWTLCVVAGRADDAMDRMFEEIYGGDSVRDVSTDTKGDAERTHHGINQMPMRTISEAREANKIITGKEVGEIENERELGGNDPSAVDSAFSVEAGAMGRGKDAVDLEGKS